MKCGVKIEEIFREKRTGLLRAMIAMIARIKMGNLENGKQQRFRKTIREIFLEDLHLIFVGWQRKCFRIYSSETSQQSINLYCLSCNLNQVIEVSIGQKIQLFSSLFMFLPIVSRKCKGHIKNCKSFHTGRFKVA